jgi:alpha/beta superfamily hydrolase
MVLEGQFLERAALIPSGKWVLEGLWHRGTREPPLLILPPLPGEGSMEHPLLAELAWAAARGGHPSLRFNFRGVGASQGDSAGERTLLEDAEAALQSLCESAGASRVGVVTLGSSAALAGRLAQKNKAVAGLAWVAPEGLRPKDVTSSSVPLLWLAPKATGALPKGLKAALDRRAGGFESTDLDARFTKGLPQVGRRVVDWLSGL